MPNKLVDQATSVASPRRWSGAVARLQRIGLLALTSIVTLNFWTGGPLLALWLGSRVQGSGGLTMLVVAVVVVTVGVVSLVLVRALNSLTCVLSGRCRRRTWRSCARSCFAGEAQPCHGREEF